MKIICICGIEYLREEIGGKVEYRDIKTGKLIHFCPSCGRPLAFMEQPEGSVTGYDQLTEIGFGDFGPM